MIAKIVIALVLVGVAITCWDMVDAQKTVVFDQIYAQSRAQSIHTPYMAKIIARKYGRKLAAAFKAEPECRGLNFSVQANRGLRGKPGRWNLDIDMMVSEEPDAEISVQPWSLILPNRDGADNGANGPDTPVMSDKDAPEMIMKKVCEVMNNAPG